ncbi:MAG: flap endonuclease-1 [Candidatus Marsarchaeota archaeon]|nr:flap endonuclease-1 [Candidatus Marsarchaeota archaeon]
MKQELSFDELKDKVIAIDAYNTIYQFLSIIRQPDGTPLTDSKGRITSHLSGLLYRTTNLLNYGAIPVFVFDGIPPTLKSKTIAARISRREKAMEEWKSAQEKGMLEEARTHAMASTRITKEVVSSAKELLGYMGMPFIQAPSEGEAQAAYLVENGLAYASASQDYDSFLFGAELVIRNVTITGKRKLPGKNVFINVKPEKIFLKDLLSNFGISRKQLVWAGMMIGTDFNDGIKGVGPKTALKITKEADTLEDIQNALMSKYNTCIEGAEEVERIFLQPDIKKISGNEFHKLITDTALDKEGLVGFMCKEHGFSEERVEKMAELLSTAKKEKRQKDINSWL